MVEKSCLHSVSVLLFSYPSFFQRIHHAKRFPIFLRPSIRGPKESKEVETVVFGLQVSSLIS